MSNGVSILITCHNRKSMTLSCLKSIHEQNNISEDDFDVYLVDDGSTDGTADAVKKKYPEVNVIIGNGNLYWNGGMRLASEIASKKKYDHYLWLNDDTDLFSDALTRLLLLAERNSSSVIVGSVRDPVTKKHTYGGVRKLSKIRPLKFIAIEPDENEALECDTFNGNCVLIPGDIMHKVGSLCADYTHSMGDFDYGLRVKKQGLINIVAPGYYGECQANEQAACFDRKNSLLQRLKALHSPKGIPPSEWVVFTRRHAPYIWPVYLFKLYIRVIFP